MFELDLFSKIRVHKKNFSVILKKKIIPLSSETKFISHKENYSVSSETKFINHNFRASNKNYPESKILIK